MTTRMTLADLRAQQERAPRRNRRDVEGPIHKAVLAYLRAALPGAVIHHSPNELAMRGRGAARILSNQKLMGMLPGFPDFLVLYAGRIIGLEVKAKGNSATDEQKAVGAAIIANGGLWAVVRSVDEAKARMVEWGVV